MLYLLSPAGFSNKTDEEILGNDPGFLKRMGFKIFDYYMHKKNINPFNLMIFKEFNLKRNFKGKRLKLPEKEAELFAKYLTSTLDKDECGERAVGVLLRFARYSNHPICHILNDMKKTTGF